MVTHQQGVFCANFGKPVIGLPLCQHAWCATCYSILPGDGFLLYQETNDKGNELIAPNEVDDYTCAWPGDHLFCPFECNRCTFHWLKGWPPIPGKQTNKQLGIFLCRSAINAFWSRQSSMIAGLLRSFFQQVELDEAFGFEMFQPPGPFPQAYDSEIHSAFGVLWQSQKPGREGAVPSHKLSQCISQSFEQEPDLALREGMLHHHLSPIRL